jgi:hypothetical protein
VPDPIRHVASLLLNFRLLEAAGACELIRADANASSSPIRSPEWWHALAECARTYRAAVYSASAHGFTAIDDWSRSRISEEDSDLACERERLGDEHRVWMCDVPGGQAYEAWLSAYVAVAELDADRALSSLVRCAAIAREFTEVPKLERELSLYEFLQRTADTIARVLPLPEHPVRDLRRFAFVPTLLRNRYGS